MSFIPKDIDNRKAISFNDYKTILQEIIQQNPEEKVEYIMKGKAVRTMTRHLLCRFA